MRCVLFFFLSLAFCDTAKLVLCLMCLHFSFEAGISTRTSSMDCIINFQFCSLSSVFIFALNIETFIVSLACFQCFSLTSPSLAVPNFTWLDSKNFYVFAVSHFILYAKARAPFTYIQTRGKKNHPASRKKPVLKQKKRTTRTKHTKEKRKNVWRWEE